MTEKCAVPVVQASAPEFMIPPGIFSASRDEAQPSLA
jgi:hypothetical protein